MVYFHALECTQTSKMKSFARVVNNVKLLTIVANLFILAVCGGHGD